MVRPICRDEMFLSQKAKPAEESDLPVAGDLLETLMAHHEECVGMAANMIGVNRCIIAFQDGAGYTVMLNPKILQKSGAYETEEGCLSLTGVRPVKRWKRIKVATVYKGNIIKNLIMDCQSYTKYRPNETTGGIFVSWRRKEELPTGA